MRKEYYVGDIIKSKNEKIINLINHYEIVSLKFAHDFKLAVEINGIEEIDDKNINKVLNITMACLDVVEYLDVNGSRKAYDYWLLENHEEDDEIYNIIDHILYFYKLDTNTLKKMYKSNGFVIVEALLSSNLNEFYEIIEKNEIVEHKSFIQIDEQNKRLN